MEEEKRESELVRKEMKGKEQKMINFGNFYL